MKEIINGKVYNTETAEKICSWENGYCSEEPYYVLETIFQKRTGEYFLYGCGGTLTKYGQSHGNSNIAGASIIPFSVEDCKKWASDKLSAVEYFSIWSYRRTANDIDNWFV